MSAEPLDGGSPTILDALGNLGDFIGGVGVIITLIYLATQIRQNTNQLRQNADLVRLAALDATSQQGMALRSQLAEAGTAALFLRGLAGANDLDAEESFRFRVHLTSSLLVMQSVYVRFRVYGLDELAWQSQIPTLVGTVRAPGVRSNWPELRRGLRSDFVAEVENLCPELASPAV